MLRVHILQTQLQPLHSHRNLLCYVCIFCRRNYNPCTATGTYYATCAYSADAITTLAQPQEPIMLRVHILQTQLQPLHSHRNLICYVCIFCRRNYNPCTATGTYYATCAYSADAIITLAQPQEPIMLRVHILLTQL